MFEQYGDRVEVVEIDANEPVAQDVDIALYDTFAQAEADHGEVDVLAVSPHAARVAVYTWNFQRHLIDSALAKGASGYLSKTLPAAQLVSALEAIHDGEVVVSPAPPRTHGVSQDWPGRTEGLTDRESEILALITQARTNADIARLTCLSINSIKSYVRSLYRKIGVTTRPQAVLWGLEHGFRPDHRRIEGWRT
ncbi:MAG: response regulator transcription factor [Ilumatobacteraceae bacterium]